MKRSKYNLSHNLLMTGDFGYLYPILVEDLLPGDKVRCASEVFVKAIPLLAPIMDSCDVRVDYFFVPNRLLWSRWEDFITGGRRGYNYLDSDGNPQDLIAPWFSFNPSGGSASCSDASFMSWMYQLSVADDVSFNGKGMRINILPALAYQRIYYDWYFDQNVESATWMEDDGLTERKKAYITDDCYDVLTGEVNSSWGTIDSALSEMLTLRQRLYRKDMFTSALPWPQRGPEVGIDIPPSDIVAGSSTGPNGVYVRSGTDTVVSPGNAQFGTNGNLNGSNDSTFDIVHTHSQNFDQGEFGTLTINELRRMSALQRWFEKNARYGSRYIEQILSHFGVRTPDYRLDRSEYLGGTVSPLNISETYQTATGTEGQETASVLGQYAGHMTSYAVNGMRKYRADEHGWLIGLLSIVPKASYAQGLQRRFSRLERLDYAWPEFAGIGEQAILNKELYIGSGDNDFGSGRANQVFGYTPRYADYKSRQDRFDRNFLNIFPFWHLGRVFGSTPTLSEEFLTSRGDWDTANNRPQADRIFAYTPADADIADREVFHLLFQIRNNLIMRRPLPKYVVPHIS